MTSPLTGRDKKWLAAAAVGGTTVGLLALVNPLIPLAVMVICAGGVVIGIARAPRV